MIDKLAGIGYDFSNEFLMAYDHKEDCRAFVDLGEIGWWPIYSGFIS